MNQYAPSKTYDIDDDVLAVLDKMEWTQHETKTHGVIVQQLDRKLYVKVNKVLQALGGKWNRGAKAHVFEHDPRPSLGLVIESAEYEVVKDGFFPTPMSVGIVMAEMADLFSGAEVLEPSAGKGNLIEAILEGEPGCHVYAIEIDTHRRNYLKQQGYVVVDTDFFHHQVRYDRIIQNPPFERNQDIMHVRHAWEILPVGGILVSVVSEGPFFRNDSNALAFRAWLHEQDTETLALDDGAFAESGTNVKARIVKATKR